MADLFLLISHNKFLRFNRDPAHTHQMRVNHESHHIINMRFIGDFRKLSFIVRKPFLKNLSQCSNVLWEFTVDFQKPWWLLLVWHDGFLLDYFYWVNPIDCLKLCIEMSFQLLLVLLCKVHTRWNKDVEVREKAIDMREDWVAFSGDSEDSADGLIFIRNTKRVWRFASVIVNINPHKLDSFIRRNRSYRRPLNKLIHVFRVELKKILVEKTLLLIMPS